MAEEEDKKRDRELRDIKSYGIGSSDSSQMFVFVLYSLGKSVACFSREERVVLDGVNTERALEQMLPHSGHPDILGFEDNVEGLVYLAGHYIPLRRDQLREREPFKVMNKSHYE